MRLFIKDTQTDNLWVEPQFENFKQMMLYLYECITDEDGDIDYDMASYLVVGSFAEDERSCLWTAPAMAFIPLLNEFIYNKRL